MAFGRNPHVAKAQAAELKAEEAPDDIARAMAHRDAAHQWDRAAEREKPGKYKDAYQANALRNRNLADEEREAVPAADRLERLAARVEEITGREGVLVATDAVGPSVPVGPKQWN